MIVCGREIPSELIEDLRQNRAAWSLRRCARELSSRLEWYGPGGKLQTCVGAQIIRALERQGHLPKPPEPEFNLRQKLYSARQGPKDSQAVKPIIEGPLEAVRPIELVRINSRFSENYRIWRELLDAHHYLRSGPLCGPQLRYLIGSAQGWLGAIAISAAARRVRGRDAWIEWNEEARRENLPWVINNSRFLILAHVRIQNLASHVLSLLTQRVAGDWEELHGYRPVLIETFVEIGRFAGICYAAANWQGIGMTAGRGRQDAKHQQAVPQKALWVFPLCKNFRQQLCTLPEKRRLPPRLTPPQPAPAPSAPQDWTEEEFGACDLGDRRLEKRLWHVAADFFARPGMNVPQACGSRAKAKAAYRLFDHPRMNLHSVLQSHYQATQRRAQEYSVILAVQDTVELNYSAHPATELLGPICDKEGVIGLLLHETMAYNLEGTALGLIDAQCWTRDPEQKRKRERRYELDIEQKESAKWLAGFRAAARLQEQCPKSMVVSVGDRESDLYELFVEAQSRASGPKLLVRAWQERVLSDPDEDGQNRSAWGYIAQLPAAGTLHLEIPRRQGKAGRTAEITLRFAAIELKPPKRKPHLEPVRVWAIAALEENPPAGAEAIHWLLLTTVPTETFEQALEKLRWYALRFQIEVYHRTLKTGCKIEDRQLGNAHRLESCLAVDLVVAWRIVHLTKLGREVPQVPCTVFFEEAQWKALVAYVTKSPVPPPNPPTLRDAIRLMAMHLGGFLGRKGDGEPGAETIWRGLQRLDDITEMYGVMRGQRWISPTARELTDTS